MKKILLLVTFCISLVGCIGLPPVENISRINNGEQKQTHITKDNLKIEYSSGITFSRNTFGGLPLVTFPKYSDNPYKIVEFSLNSYPEYLIKSLIFENNRDKVIFKMTSYEQIILEAQEVSDYYGNYNHNVKNTMFFTTIPDLKKLLLMLENSDTLRITLDCFRGKIPYTISKKDEQKLIEFIKILIEIDSEKGSN